MCKARLPLNRQVSQVAQSVAEFWFCNALRRMETAVLNAATLCDRCRGDGKFSISVTLCDTLRHTAINGNTSPKVLRPTAIPEQ